MALLNRQRNKILIMGTCFKTDNEYVTSYENPYTNITVYSFSYYISHTIDRYSDEKYIDATSFLDELNRLAIQNHWFVVVNDFSGRIMNNLAEYYDQSLIDHKNHIVYSIGMRIDGGCFLDLLNPICNFVFNHSGKGITVFNPFNYEDDYCKLFDNVKVFSDFLSSEEYDIIKRQTQIFIQSRKTFLVDNLLSLLRKAYLLKKKSEILWPSPESYKNLEKQYNINISHMINNQQHDDLICKLFLILV